jgi:hypothetical protein
LIDLIEEDHKRSEEEEEDVANTELYLNEQGHT